MVCMGCEVETKSMVTHDKTNGRWEGLGLMGDDELRDMRCLVPMRHMPHLLKLPIDIDQS
jgi:hypothetical protein